MGRFRNIFQSRGVNPSQGRVKRRIIIIGVINSPNQMQYAFENLCSYMKNTNSDWSVTYTNVISDKLALSQGMPVPSSVKFPYYLVFDNPYDNHVNWEKVLFKTSNIYQLEGFLGK